MTDKNEKIDYGDIPITKLPPGEAYGARDLTKWAHNRAMGRSGVPERLVRSADIHCNKCDGRSTAMVEGWKKSGGPLSCRQCGSKNTRVLKIRKMR